MALSSWSLKSWTVCGIALVCFCTGSLLTARLSHIEQVRANSSRVFELRVYHALPGKLPVMESRFRDTTSRLLARHNLDVLGYWTSEGAPGSGGTFIFLIAHRSRDEAASNWKSMGTDPEFQQVIKAEQAEKTLANADVTYMRPTDFSPLK
jgi:NIPSNAP